MAIRVLLLWLMSWPIWAAVVPCDTVASLAGKAFELRPNWVATTAMVPEVFHKDWTLKAEFKQWQIWQTPFELISQCSPQLIENRQQSLWVYPVLWQKNLSKPAVVTGKVIIQTTTEKDLQDLVKIYPLKFQTKLPLAFSAVFIPNSSQDMDRLFLDLSLDPRVISASPLLSYQRYRLR